MVMVGAEGTIVTWLPHTSHTLPVRVIVGIVCLGTRDILSPTSFLGIARLWVFANDRHPKPTICVTPSRFRHFLGRIITLPVDYDAFTPCAPFQTSLPPYPTIPLERSSWPRQTRTDIGPCSSNYPIVDPESALLGYANVRKTPRIKVTCDSHLKRSQEPVCL